MTDEILTPEIDDTPHLDEGGQLALVETLFNEIKVTRDQMRAHRLAEFENNGIVKMQLRIGNQKVGDSIVCQAKPKVHETDRYALEEWAKENGYMKIVVDIDAIKSEVRNVDGYAVIGDGEIVPGLEFDAGSNYVKVNCDEDDVLDALSTLGVTDPLSLLVDEPYALPGADNE